MKSLANFKRQIKNKIREYVETDILIQKGMVVGENFFRGKNVEIDYDFCWLIEFGNNVTLAPGVRVLAHDASIRRFLGYTRIGVVEIGDNVFVGADSIILPGVRMGSNIIVGAGSVVTSDLESNYVYAGNPAKKIYKMEEYLTKYQNVKNIYKENETFKNDKLTLDKKLEIKRQIKQNNYISYSR